MRERPILMSAPMVRAILDGRKTQIRRPLKHQPPDCAGVWSFVACSTNPKWRDTFCYSWPDANGKSFSVRGRESCMHIPPPCFTGDRLWVRETWSETVHADNVPVVAYRAGGCIAVGRDMCEAPDYLIHDFAWTNTPESDARGWRPSVHMPRWASRITLEITNVRVERLNEISAADAIAEGLKTLSKDGGRTYKHGMPDVDGLPGGEDWKWTEWEICPRAAFKKLWESTYGPGSFNDKWVWVIDFRRIKP